MAKANQLQKSNPYLVVQDNDFINFRHTLTVQEARVFLSVVAQVEKDDIDFKVYKIDVEQFVEAVGLKRKDMYSELKKVSDQLTSKKFRQEKEDGSFLITNYISSAEYRSGEGFVELTFDPKLKPFLLGLKSKFTQYDIRNILSLRSVFSVLLYQQLKQYEKLGKRLYPLIDLKYKLNVDDKYKNYAHFRIKVLETAQKEIKEHCDIYFKFEEIKKGKRVESIMFYIYTQTPPREQTKLIEQPKPKPQDEPSHISNKIKDIPYIEVKEPPKQAQPQTIATPPPHTPSIPSMATIQELGEKLKLNIEQINTIKEKYNHDNIRVWEVLYATTKQEGIKNKMAYIMGSTGLGAGIWNEKQNAQKKKEDKQRQEIQAQKLDIIKSDFSSYENKKLSNLYNSIGEEERSIINDEFLSIEQNRKNRAWYDSDRGITPFGTIEAMKYYLVNHKGYDRANELETFATANFNTKIKFDKDGKPFIQE